jgi:hypothetical protein
MKRALTVLLLCAAAAAGAAGAHPELAGWVPAECQLVLEIARLDEVMAPVAAAPDPAAQLPAMWAQLGLPWTPSRWPATAPADWPSLSVLMAVSRGVDVSPESASVLLAIGCATDELYARFADNLRPPAGSPATIRAVGPYTLYSGATAPSGFLILGERTILVGRGFDPAVLAELRRGAAVPGGGAAAGPDPALPGVAILRLRLNLAAMGFLSDETMRTAAGRLVQALQAPPAESGTTPVLPTLRGLFGRITPEQMTAFLTGLGLDSLRALTVTVAGDAEEIGLAMALEVDRAGGLIYDYMTGLHQRRLTAWPLLPADALVVVDSLADTPRLLRLLREHARNTLGAPGETVFIGLELAAGARLGLSFMEQILPLAGAEWGLAVLPPGAPGEPPRLVGFCVPEDPALLPVVLGQLAPRIPLGVTKPDAAGEPFYTLDLNPSAGKPARVYLLQAGPALFASDRPEALRQILAAGQSGATFRPPASPAAPADATCIQLLYARPGLLAGLGVTGPAAGSAFIGQSHLSDHGLTVGLRMPRAALAGLGRLLPGLLERALPSAVALVPAAPKPAAPTP